MIGMRITERTADRCAGTLPIDKRTVQPAGVAHGSALIALAETLASIGTLDTVVGGSLRIGAAAFSFSQRSWAVLSMTVAMVRFPR